MLSGRTLLSRASLFAITFMATAPLLHADDSASASSSDRYKTVAVPIGGGKTTSIRVEQQSDPLKHANMTDELDSHRAFSATNDLANKSFSMPIEAGTQDTSRYNSHDSETFITKSYTPESSATVPNLNSKMNFAGAEGYGHNAAGFDKGYNASTSATDLNKSAILGTNETADEQGRTAVLGTSDKNEVMPVDSLANKQYLGPGAQKVPEGEENPDNMIVSRVQNLPNRSLTVDEVRNLINHETKPDLESKPDAPSKALNDPNYKPQPLRDDPSPDDKTDAVPPPGTMSTPQSAPENSQPLPQP